MDLLEQTIAQEIDGPSDSTDILPVDHTSSLLDEISPDEHLADDPIATVDRFELIFVDSSVEGHELILAELRNQAFNGTGLQVVLIDSNQDGIDQVNHWLDQLNQQFDAVHFVTHGTDGAFQLGSTLVDQQLLEQREGDFAAWRQWLNDEADVLIYGCDLASSDDGKMLLQTLHEITGADMAGSEDVTGHSDLGGNWVLEFSIGQIDSQLVFSADVMANWFGTLDLNAIGNEVRVNTTTTGTQATMQYGGNAIAADSSGNYVVVWQDNRGGDFDIWAQRFNASRSLAASSGQYVPH